MAEVRSKMTDVKFQLEARGEVRAGPSGGATGEQGPSYHADSDLGPSRKSTELDLMGKGPGASRHCRSGEWCSGLGSNRLHLNILDNFSVFLMTFKLALGKKGMFKFVPA